MHFDALLLSRLQFGITLSSLVVFSSLALGLAGYVAVLEGLWLTTRTEAFLTLRGLWTKAFLAALVVAAPAAGLAATTHATAATWTAATHDFPFRAAQLALSAVLATALAVGAVSAVRLRKDVRDVESGLALKMAIGMFVICAPLELAVSDVSWSRPQLIIGIASAAAVLGLWGGLLCWRGAPERSRPFLVACILMSPASVLTPIAEWSGGGLPH